MTSRRIRFLIVCSNEYSKYARVLIYSILKNTKNTLITCVVYSNDLHKVRIKKHSRLTLTTLKIPEGKTEDELRNFYAISRAKEIFNALSLYNDDIVFLDSDSLVRNNKFDALVSTTKVQALARDNENENSKFLISTIYFPGTENSKEFAHQWEKSLRPNLYGPWYSDQITFYKIYLQNKDLVSSIDESFCDVHHRKNSTIWSAKGGMKFNKNWRHSYTREYLIYRCAMYFTEFIKKILKVNIYAPTDQLIWIFSFIVKCILSLGRKLKSLTK